jgi:outer membrane protein TolC
MLFQLFVAKVAFSSSASGYQTFNLKKTIQFAIEHSPALSSSKKNLTISELQYRSSWARLLPSLDLITTHGLENNIPIAANNSFLTPNAAAPWYSSLNLGLTETLYDNGVTLTNISIADLTQKYSTLSYKKARDQ